MSNASNAKTVLIAIWFLSLGVLFVIALGYFICEKYTDDHFSYGLMNGEYVELKEGEEEKKYPSIFHFELNELGGRNRETWIDAKLAFSTTEFTLQDEQKMEFTVKSGEYWPTEYKTREYQKGERVFSNIFKKVKLSPSRGSHLQFPLEGLHFSISIETEPATKFKRIEFYNRTPGLVLKENPKPVLKKDMIEISFDLRRGIFDQILFYVFAVVSLLYVYLFLRYIKKKFDLTIYVSGFFIALWSIRGIFSFGVKAFPTYLDYVTLTLSVILLVGILSKILMGLYQD